MKMLASLVQASLVGLQYHNEVCAGQLCCSKSVWYHIKGSTQIQADDADQIHLWFILALY